MAQTISRPPASDSQPLPPEPKPDQPKHAWNRRLLLLPAGLVVAGAGLAAWFFLSRPETEVLELSGRIEGYETNIGTEVSGRVESVAVREGDLVRQGQVIVRLDEAELEARLQAAEAQINAAQQQARQSGLQIQVIESQIREVQLNLQRSQGESTGRISEAEARVAAAEAQLNQAQAQVTEARANVELAQEDRDRYAQLLRQGAIPQQRFDQALTTLKTAQATLQARQAAVNAAQKQVNAAQGALVQAQTTDLNPEIFQAQLSGLQKQLAQAQAQLQAAEAEVARVQANRREIVAQIDDLTIESPINGVVITRSVEPGEVVSSGRPLLSVVNLNHVYLRGFIPEGQIGLVRVGQPARVFLDSAPDQPLRAQVTAIDPQASFTPENIYFRQDRVQQVFGVKLGIENPAGFAKPGMPADGTIVLPEEP